MWHAKYLTWGIRVDDPQRSLGWPVRGTGDMRRYDPAASAAVLGRLDVGHPDRFPKRSSGRYGTSAWCLYAKLLASITQIIKITTTRLWRIKGGYDGDTGQQKQIRCQGNP